MKWKKRTDSYQINVSGLTINTFEIVENSIMLATWLDITINSAKTEWVKIANINTSLIMRSFVNAPKWNTTDNNADAQIKFENDGIYVRSKSTGNFVFTATTFKM